MGSAVDAHRLVEDSLGLLRLTDLRASPSESQSARLDPPRSRVRDGIVKGIETNRLLQR